MWQGRPGLAMVGRAVPGEPLHAPYYTSTTTLKNRIAAFSAAVAPSTAFSHEDQTDLVGNPEIPSRKVKPWLSLKNPLHVGNSNPP